VPSVSSTRRRGLPTPLVVACVAFGVAVAAWGALWLTAFSVQRTERTTRTYVGVDHLKIDGGDGDIDVIAEDRGDVQVTARVVHGLGGLHVKQGFEGGALKLTSDCNFWGSFGPNGCTADFEVRVPRAVTLDVRGSSGDVSARGMTAAAYLGASSGSVRAIDAAGRLKVGASSGDVDVEGYRGRDVEASASSGNVTVRTRVVPTRLRAVASSGDVTVVVPGDVPYFVEARADSGDTHVGVDQSREAPRTIEARASSGNVRVARLDDAR
jgi:Putative adhesin